MKLERIDKIVSGQGGLSRKEVKDLIKRKQIKVNGILVERPEQKFGVDTSVISVCGEILKIRKNIYIMMNKPKGYVSATMDKKIQTVLELVPPEMQRKGLFPAGRLDKDTTGFMLITDDGKFAHNILSPKKHIEKTYLATVNGKITSQVVSAFEKGIEIDSGDVCKPAKIEIIKNTDTKSLAKVTISEGMYHQIKRMFSVFRLEVLELHRAKMGNLPLDESLLPGECREMTEEEISAILS